MIRASDDRREKDVGYDLKVLTGNTNRPLAEEICTVLDTHLADATITRFPGGETHVQIDENVRGCDVFIVQPICSNEEEGVSPNDALMELLILCDASRRASSRRITAVVPYYGYARQDRKDRPRVPITAKLVANMIYTAGARRVLALDLHANQIQGFFDIPVDHLYSINILGEYFKQKNLENLVVVSPDVGGIKMARAYAEILGAPLAIIDKRRWSGQKTEVLNIIGEVKDKNIVIVDDLISTGGSLTEAASALKDKGALDISATIVHPVLADPAIDRVENSVLTELVVSNSIPVPKRAQNGKIKVLSVAPILAESIRRINNDESVSNLFANAKVEG
ncbi:MAG: ribose-phosphate pyrophosphokinase [Candidatus Latescibacteria bacterium]|jgi:ribose-phosphate pyrophosphokinase|nr:ribose-phosphate pyrophosphokinase [Candidatus Latescibacterota bacterium]